MKFAKHGVWATLALSCCLSIVLTHGRARADEPRPQRIGNLPTNLQVIPKLPPREMGTLPESEREPVSSFLQSVSGGDAILEVLVGQSRVITINGELAKQDGVGVIASGDPTVIDFDVLPNPRLIRVVGKRVGVTDLTFVTSDGQNITYEVHVMFDLPLVQTQLQALFPDIHFQLSQMREHVVIQGEAPSPSHVTRILETLRVYLTSMQVDHSVESEGPDPEDIPVPRRTPSQPDKPGSDTPAGEGEPGAGDQEEPGVAFDPGTRPKSQAKYYLPQIINLMRVPGPQQVMLKVTIAELNRVALRRIATNLEFGPQLLDGDSGANLNDFVRSIQTDTGNLVGVFSDGDVEFLMDALRQNSVTTVLAQPNLITMSGHTSRFQSGGEFPVPVPQAGVGVGTTTIEYKPFGVQLGFTPLILDDGVIRLTVEPEVSDIDPNLSVRIVPGSDPVPAIRTRNASTTVQMREGQTLAIAGLLNDASRARTSRVPLLGDIPYLGALFTNNAAESREDELLIVVTPHLISPLDGEYQGCLPGQEIQEPNDYEFYLLNRIEGRTAQPHRATTNWDDPLGIIRKWQLEQRHGCGPIGFSE